MRYHPIIIWLLAIMIKKYSKISKKETTGKSNAANNLLKNFHTRINKINQNTIYVIIIIFHFYYEKIKKSIIKTNRK